MKKVWGYYYQTDPIYGIPTGKPKKTRFGSDIGDCPKLVEDYPDIGKLVRSDKRVGLVSRELFTFRRHIFLIDREVHDTPAWCCGVIVEATSNESLETAEQLTISSEWDRLSVRGPPGQLAAVAKLIERFRKSLQS